MWGLSMADLQTELGDASSKVETELSDASSAVETELNDASPSALYAWVHGGPTVLVARGADGDFDFARHGIVVWRITRGHRGGGTTFWTHREGASLQIDSEQGRATHESA